MTDKQIYKKIEDTYADEKGKRFISHLIHSFFPVDKATYALVKLPPNSKCCLTGTPLISKDEAMQIQFDGMDEMLNYIKNIALLTDDGKPQPEHPMVKKLNGRVLAVVCEKSDKMLCAQSHGQLFNFVSTKLLTGDGNINFILNRTRSKAMSEHMKKNDIIRNKSDERVVRKVTEHKKITTLGDLQVLQDLKARMDEQEKIKDKEENVSTD